MRSILMLLLLIFPAALMLADTHRDFAGNIDFSAFKTFVVRQGYPTSRQPSPENQGTKRTPDVDSKLTQAVQDALRSTLSSKGLKETLETPRLLFPFARAVVANAKVTVTNTATNTTIWYGQHIDNEQSSASLEKYLPDAIRKMISNSPPKKK